MGFSFFFHWAAEYIKFQMGRAVWPPKPGFHEKNLDLVRWSLAVLFHGLSWISPITVS
jgi:hypothetical protein